MRDHRRQDRLGHQQGTQDVHAQLPHQFVLGHIEARAGNGDPGVVHQHGHGAEQRLGRADDPLAVGPAGVIHRDRGGRPAAGADPVADGGRRAFVQVCADDRRTLAGKQLSNGPAVAGGGAGHDRAAPGQTAHAGRR